MAAWPGVMVMRVNAAFGMMLAALSLIFWHWAGAHRRLRRVATLCGWGAALIGGLTSVEYLTGADFGIDQWIAPGTFPGDHASAFVVVPGRMSLNAALALLMLGLALAGLDSTITFRGTRRHFVAPFFALLAALPSGCGLVGYLLGANTFTGLLRSTNILWHVAACLFLLSVGVLAIRPDRPPVSRVFAPGAGGVLLRWLLPGSTVVLLTLGWAISKARAAGMVAPEEGTALMLYGGLVLLSGLMVAASRAVTRQEARAERAAQAMATAAERFHLLAETVALQVWTATPSGELDFANDEVAQYFGGDLQRDVLGQAWAQYVHADDLPAALHSWEVALASGRRYEVEFRLRRHDGEDRWFLIRAEPVREAGRVVSWSGTNTDIHDLKTAQRAAEQASRAKDDFLAALSHELRTPLMPVLLSASALRHDERLPADVRADLAMIERNVQLEGRLIDDLLDLTRITRGKLPLHVAPCDVHSLLGHSIEIIRDEARGKRVGLKIDLAARRSGVIGDPARLQQVFWNLLRNAVKFTPSGGSIHIRSRDSGPDDSLILEVSDTGLGFVPELAERLFLPFEQEERDSHHRFGGLGLGLAIARAIVDQHGGRIWAHSGGRGLGATFTVELPSASEPPLGLADGEPELSPPEEAAKSLRILLVEDHEPTRLVLTKLLTKAGHQIIGAGNIASAVAAHETASFDLVISDLGLPDGSGFELLGQLRVRDATLRGIALSGYGMEEDIAHSRRVGFIAHLVKPVDFNQLSRALRELTP